MNTLKTVFATTLFLLIYFTAAYRLQVHPEDYVIQKQHEKLAEEARRNCASKEASRARCIAFAHDGARSLIKYVRTRVGEQLLIQTLTDKGVVDPRERRVALGAALRQIAVISVLEDGSEVRR